MTTTLLENAISAIKSGNKQSGEWMLHEVLKEDPQNDNALVWLAFLTKTEKERREYLERAILINPSNQAALQGLNTPKPEKLSVEKPPIVLKYCTQCGGAINVADKFCPNCGNNLLPNLSQGQAQKTNRSNIANAIGTLEGKIAELEAKAKNYTRELEEISASLNQINFGTFIVVAIGVAGMLFSTTLLWLGGGLALLGFISQTYWYSKRDKTKQQLAATEKETAEYRQKLGQLRANLITME